MLDNDNVGVSLSSSKVWGKLLESALYELYFRSGRPIVDQVDQISSTSSTGPKIFKFFRFDYIHFLSRLYLNQRSIVGSSFVFAT